MAGRIDSLGPTHVAFEEWAKDCGIKINGVGATRFYGQGLGIAALRKIDVRLPHISSSYAFKVLAWGLGGKERRSQKSGTGC